MFEFLTRPPPLDKLHFWLGAIPMMFLMYGLPCILLSLYDVISRLLSNVSERVWGGILTFLFTALVVAWIVCLYFNV